MKPEIIQSSNYDLFKPHSSQRDINPAHVRNLAKSMEVYGFIPGHPIYAYKDGKSLIIIDGHHRLNAAKTAGVPIYYVVTDKSAAGQIAPINDIVKKWKEFDYVRMHASNGLSDYAVVLRYVEKGLSLKWAISLLAGEYTASSNKTDIVHNGRYRVKTTQYADEVLSIIHKTSHIPETKHDPFISAIAILIRLPQFDINTLLQRIESNPKAIVRCSSRDQTLEMLEEIYNFRSREKINLAFLAKEILRERNPIKKGAA